VPGAGWLSVPAARSFGRRRFAVGVKGEVAGLGAGIVDEPCQQREDLGFVSGRDGVAGDELDFGSSQGSFLFSVALPVIWAEDVPDQLAGRVWPGDGGRPGWPRRPLPRRR